MKVKYTGDAIGTVLEPGEIYKKVDRPYSALDVVDLVKKETHERIAISEEEWERHLEIGTLEKLD